MALWISLLPFFITFFLQLSPMSAFSVFDFGAKPDGRTDATKPFLATWASACRSTKPAIIYVPKGRYLLSSLVFQGPCRSTIKFWIDGTIIANSNSGTGNWIEFNRVNGLSILGGTLDGQGAALWSCKQAGRNCPIGPSSLTIGICKNVKINGLTSINSKFFHVFIYGSEGVTVQGGKLIAPDESPNTDGIHVQMSEGITIIGTTIRTGDDCVSIGPGSSNLWIANIFCGPGHGISIGSLGNQYQEAGVKNVTVQNVAFTGTQNGLRIKTWGRPSNGFVTGVVFQHATMINVQNPIAIDQNYCPSIKGCPNQNSGIKISDVVYSDIKGTSATEVAVNFDCSSSNPCKGIGLQDVKLTYQNRPAKSSCNHVVGKASGGISLQNSCL